MGKRERRSQVQRYNHTVTENTNKKYNMLGNFKAKVSKLNNRCIPLINKQVWPLTDYSLKKDVVSLIELIQFEISNLCTLNKHNESLKFIEFFSFSLIIRLYVIDQIRTKSSRNSPGIDGTIIKNSNDYNTCFKLLQATHPKNIKYSEDMALKTV